VLAPVSFLLALGLQEYFAAFADIIRRENFLEDVPTSLVLSKMLVGTVMLLIGIFIFLLGTLFAKLAVILVVCSEMNEQQISWGEALSLTFGIRLLRGFGQVLLEYLAYIGLVGLPYIMLITGIVTRSPGLAVLGGLGFMVTVPLVIYLVIRWAFTLPIIAWENLGVLASFNRSAYLVRGGWWRVFGILLLLTIITQFALSIITTPINMFALWEFYSRYFELLGSFHGGRQDMEAVFQLISSMGMGLGIVIGISSILSMLVTPVYTTVMYFDLRARKGEFAQPTPPAATRFATGVQT
jgi:hypothetical protein